jgi:putative glycosyltransferase (TIGR04372 family)
LDSTEEEDMIIDSIIDYISNMKCCPAVLLSPNVYAVGNCAEEIYFGLLKARREGKKLYILRPYDIPWLLKYQLTNRELFRIESDCCYPSKDNFIEELIRLGLTVAYIPSRVLNLLLKRYSGRCLNDSYSFPEIGRRMLWQPKIKMKNFSWEVVYSYDWEAQINGYLPVRLCKESLDKAQKIRSEMGIPKEDWFVCLHVREGGFRNDWNRREWRNATISNYIPAIQTITEAGGWVIRMGDNTMAPLPKIDRVIDYPHSPFKSDLMDIYLISNCQFYIGAHSGILDVAVLFQKPMIIPNMNAWTFGYPCKAFDIGITKHIYSCSQRRFLSIKEMFEGSWSMQEVSGSLGEDFKMYENSPEEIKTLVCEYMDSTKFGVKKLTPLQEEANRQRVLQAYRLFEEGKVPGDADDCINMVEKYRIASRIESSVGALGRTFLEDNWYRSSKN